MTLSKQCLFATTGSMLIWPHRLRKQGQNLHKWKSNKILAWRGEVGSKSHLQERNSTVDGCLERENQSSLVETHWVTSTTLQDRSNVPE